MPRGSNLGRLGDFNQAVVLDAVRRSPGISRAELRDRSGLSSQTISNITRRLLDDAMIQEDEPLDGGRGRPRIPLHVRASGSYSVGVHIDPARLTLVVVDLAGDLRGLEELRTPQAEDPTAVTRLIADAVDALIEREGLERDRVLGIGIAAPGPLDVATGVVLDPPQLPDWRNVPLRADLHRRTGLPVLLDKDVTAAATAELQHPAGPGPDFVFLYLGSGVGAGVVMGGTVLRGATNNIGEVGDVLVDLEAEDLGWAGRRGGLAAACVPEALVRQAVVEGLLPSVDWTDYLAVDDACTVLCARATGKGSAERRLLERAAQRVAVGLGVLLNMLDLPVVVLGGPLWERLSDVLLPLLGELVDTELVAARAPAVVLGSAVGDQVAAIGAAELVMDHFLAPRPAVLIME